MVKFMWLTIVVLLAAAAGLFYYASGLDESERRVYKLFGALLVLVNLLPVGYIRSLWWHKKAVRLRSEILDTLVSGEWIRCKVFAIAALVDPADPPPSLLAYFSPAPIREAILALYNKPKSMRRFDSRLPITLDPRFAVYAEVLGAASGTIKTVFTPIPKRDKEEGEIWVLTMRGSSLGISESSVRPEGDEIPIPKADVARQLASLSKRRPMG